MFFGRSVKKLFLVHEKGQVQSLTLDIDYEKSGITYFFYKFSTDCIFLF